MSILIKGYGLSGGDSIEASTLETDVMRFLAIIGFCLMIVFALVQSLPVSAVSEAMGDALSKKTGFKFDTLKLQNSTLKLMIEVEVLSGQVIVHDKLIKQLKQNLISQLEKLSDIEKNLEKKRHQLEAIVDVNQSVAHELGLAKEKLREITQKIATLEKNEVNQASHRTVEHKSISKNGYQLSFSSNGVFRELVLSQKVLLLIQQDGVYKQYNNGAFMDASVSGRLFEMMINTVPDEFIAIANLSSQDGNKWFVKLPEQTEAEIHRMMSQHDSGLIMIGKGGSVFLNTDH